MLRGKVKWFNSVKGYGFILPDDGGKDIFVHITEIEKSGVRRLNEGQIIGYDIYDDKGRVAAGNIKVLG